MTNRTEFNITGWDRQEVDARHFLPIDQFTDGDTLTEVFVDMDYKDAKHRVSFYVFDGEDIDEFMEKFVIERGYHDDLFYEQLESTNPNFTTLIQ